MELEFELSSRNRKGKKSDIQKHTHMDSKNLKFEIWGTQLSIIDQKPVLDLNSYISKSLFFGNSYLVTLTVCCAVTRFFAKISWKHRCSKSWTDEIFFGKSEFLNFSLCLATMHSVKKWIIYSYQIKIFRLINSWEKPLLSRIFLPKMFLQLRNCALCATILAQKLA